MKNLNFILLISLLLTLNSCFDLSEHNETTPSTQNPIVVTVDGKGVPTSATGVKVTDNPTQSLSFQETKSIKVGTILKLRLNRSGFEVKEYNVKFDGIYDKDGEHLIFCTTNDDLVIGQGDSGSPLLNSDGKVIGALCYGFEFTNNQFAARAIEDLIEISTTQNSTNLISGKSNLYKELGLVNYTLGVNENTLKRYGKNSSLFANTQFVDKESSLLKSSSNTVIPGNSIAVNLVSGDDYSFGAIGTLSYRTDNNKLLAFGHPFGVDVLSAPATTASMVTMINSDYIAFKLALPSDQSIGCMVKDKDAGILIDPNATPIVFNHQVTITLTGELAEELGTTISSKHTVANFKEFEKDNSYSGLITSMVVFDKILSKIDVETQATCNLNVTFKNSPPLSTSFPVDNISGMIDYDISTAINDFITSHISEVKDENITDFNVNIAISEYVPEIIETTPVIVE